MTVYECRECGYMIHEEQLLLAKFDFKCPRCGQQTISQFKPKEIPPEETIKTPT